ncbi:enoyl-CoA hydratase [Kineococcus gypseus]|uniref:enoyl-CoA hydratase n=1 Tax=Kineococcus gypseus TaxID=1637102 RepID=UPI003D7C9A3F
MSGETAAPPDAPGRVLVRREGPVLHAQLSNPRRRNALTWAMYDQLLALCDAVDADPATRLVVLRGAPGAFAAGTDVSQFPLFTGGADGVAYERRVGRVLQRLLEVRVPVLGVVDGPAVGAGLAIAAVCDVLVATPSSSFGAPVARTLGNCLPAAVVARLQQRLGAARTTAVLLTARLLDAREAAEAGFVHAVLAPQELEEGVADLVRRLCAGAPLTLAALKEIDRRVAAAGAGAEDEDLLERCYGSADFREGVAAFLEHRSPRWEGR